MSTCDTTPGMADKCQDDIASTRRNTLLSNALQDKGRKKGTHVVFGKKHNGPIFCANLGVCGHNNESDHSCTGAQVH